ncbi:MAG: PIN domain-containing protein, partial [Granulosicoccaceae bacterium]
KAAPLSGSERQALMSAFFKSCEWVSVYFLWRLNLKDEADNHVLELAVAGGATHIITGNTRDFKGAELRFTHLEIVTPRQFLAGTRGN